MSNLSTTDYRETLSVGELARTCLNEVEHYYNCYQDSIVFHDHCIESHFTFIAECCNRSPCIQTPSRTFHQVAPNIIFCFFSMSPKLGDKGAAVPNVDHDSLHARILGKLPVM